MTDTELLVLDRGQGKTTAIIEAVDAQVHQSLGGKGGPDRHRTGIVFQPHGAAAGAALRRRLLHELTLRTSRVRFRATRLSIDLVMPEPGHRWSILVDDGHQPLDRYRGLLHAVGWVDDAQDFDQPIIELAQDHMIDVKLATLTPARTPPRADAAPIGYRPALIRHALGREPGEHDDREPGRDRAQPRDRLQPVHARHRQIQDHGVGTMLGHDGHAALAVLGLADHGEPAPLLQAEADEEPEVGDVVAQHDRPGHPHGDGE